MVHRRCKATSYIVIYSIVSIDWHEINFGSHVLHKHRSQNRQKVFCRWPYGLRKMTVTFNHNILATETIETLLLRFLMSLSLLWLIMQSFEAKIYFNVTAFESLWKWRKLIFRRHFSTNLCKPPTFCRLTIHWIVIKIIVSFQPYVHDHHNKNWEVVDSYILS
jgi:hypothetical protein